MPISSNVASLWARHREIARTTRELEESSDRVLADLGVSRRDIAVIAHGGYARPTATTSEPARAPDRKSDPTKA